MTPVQIAYFKHFLFDKGIQKIYISMYRHYRFKGSPAGDKDANPESIEEFFLKETHYRVVMFAFYFSPNSAYGYDYWNDVNRKWQQYWAIHKDNFSNEKYVTLKGTFSILRQNWDKEKYFEIESKKETYERMGIEPPLKIEDVETAFDIPPQEPKYKIPDSVIPSEATATEGHEEGLSLDGFSEVEVTNENNSRRKLPHDRVTVNTKGGYRITFSASKSEEIFSHNYSYIKLLTNKDTREVALLFNHSDGIHVNLNKTDAHKNVTVSCKSIVSHICKFFGVTKEYFILNITATIEQSNCTIIKFKYPGETPLL